MKPMTPLDRHRMGWLLLTLSLVGCARPHADALSSEEHMVQWEAMSGQFELVQDDSPASRATGALRIPLRHPLTGEVLEVEGHDVRGTCGVTFISPEYAVTAAHCVNFTPDPDVDLIRVETYKVSGVDDPESLLQQAGTLDGTFPNYTRQTRFEDVADYHVESYDCNVAAFCSQPPHHCDNTSADVALLRCPDRRGDAGWLAVASSDAGIGGPVEMYWFHEVLDMPVSDSGDLDRYNHYTTVIGPDPEDKAENFHYLDADANLLLPLRSIPWPFDGPRTRVAAGTTDLFGCHGTSGSGVLQENAQGELELLGPAVGGPGWSTEFLCNTRPSFGPGDASVTYASHGAVLELVAEHSEGENDLDEDRDRGSCGCQNVGIGQVCQPAVDLCSEGFYPRCDPQQGDFPVVACGYCYCD